MSAIPIFTPFLDDEAKTRIDTHVRKQFSLGNNIQSKIITGVQALNWANKDRIKTLLRTLMEVESIYNKTVIKK